MVQGHCDDEEGGAWRYRNGENDECTYAEDSPESNNAPKDQKAADKLPRVFPGVESVVDYGGGPGTYLTALRNAGASRLVTVEPHPLGDCLFAITRAGFPTAVAPSGTSHSTTLIAPILA